MPGEHVGTERQPVAGRVRTASPFFSRSNPHDVGLPSPACSAVRPYVSMRKLRGIGQRREHRHVEPLDQALRVALMPRRGKHDRRLAAGRDVHKLARHGERIEEQQPLPVVDRVGRNVLAPRLGRLPLRVRCLPVPQPGRNSRTAPMLLKRCGLLKHATVVARVGCHWRKTGPEGQDPVRATLAVTSRLSSSLLVSPWPY